MSETTVKTMRTLFAWVRLTTRDISSGNEFLSIIIILQINFLKLTWNQRSENGDTREQSEPTTENLLPFERHSFDQDLSAG